MVNALRGSQQGRSAGAFSTGWSASSAAKWGHSSGGHSPRGGNGNDSFGCQNGNRGMRPVFRGKWHVFRGKWRHFRGKIGIPPIPTHSPRPGNRGIFPPFPQLLGEWPHLVSVSQEGDEFSRPAVHADGSIAWAQTHKQNGTNSTTVSGPGYDTILRRPIARVADSKL